MLDIRQKSFDPGLVSRTIHVRGKFWQVNAFVPTVVEGLGASTRADEFRCNSSTHVSHFDEHITDFYMKCVWCPREVPSHDVVVLHDAVSVGTRYNAGFVLTEG